MIYLGKWSVWLVVITFVTCGPLVACSDSRWDEKELPESLRPLFYQAERDGNLAAITYLYRNIDERAITSEAYKLLAERFKTVALEEGGLGRTSALITDTLEFEKTTRHRIQCHLYVDATRLGPGYAGYTRVALSCEVMSYWTLTNKPPTHSPGDLLFWSADWYYDQRASLIEEIKTQEILRERLNYASENVVRVERFLYTDKQVEEVLRKSSGKPGGASDRPTVPPR